MPDTPPMSAEDRAAKALNAFLLDAEGVEIFNGPEVSKLLSSEGLAVVAREDVLTAEEAKGMDDYLEGEWADMSETGREAAHRCAAKLRRLSGADQDG